MSQDDLERWESRYRQRPGGSLAPNPWLVERAWPLIAGRAAGRPLLDVAAGEGGNALALAAQGALVTALDIAPTALGRLATEARVRGLTVRTHEVDLDLPAALDGLGPFTAITVLKYKPTPSQWCKIVSVLDPDGRLVLCSFGLAQEAMSPAFRLDPREILPLLEGLGLALVLHEPVARGGDHLEGFVWRRP